MKKIALILFVCFLGIHANAQQEDYFITTWKTDNPGDSDVTAITIPTTGYGYNYDVDWNNDGVFDDLGVTGNITHSYGTAGTYTVAIRGSFPRIYFNSRGDYQKILSIEQWGTNTWSSMRYAFMGCINLVGNATDAPDLSMVTDMRGMFSGASVFNGLLGNWNVENVTNMQDMFADASLFDQDIGNWNVENVTNMNSMFWESHSFNQDISGWNVGNVTEMTFMFSGAHMFNQNIGSWNVSNVTNMGYMFSETTFNQDIGNWNVGNAINMEGLFRYAVAFNQNIGNWNVSQVTNMWKMFEGASAFNQDLGNWNVSNVTYMASMFDGANLSTANYDALLNGWNTLNLKYGVPFGAGHSQYCNGLTAKNNIISTFGWTISDGGQLCLTPGYFITTWKTDNLGSSNATSITIPTIGSGYNYDVDWENDGVFDDFGITGSLTHDYGTSGTYTIAIRGDFPRIYFNNTGDCRKIQSIGQWGTNTWTSMNSAFEGCFNLWSNAMDTPDLSLVTDMSRMFYGSWNFNQDIGNWNVSTVNDMSFMFAYAWAFNKDIGNWDVSNVTLLNNMFQGTYSFNQDLGNWNVSNVTDMSWMFNYANGFNQNIGSWNVSRVTDMNNMFSYTSSFNQDIGSWNVGNVSNMESMFSYASVFNQNLNNWNVGSVTNMSDMFMNASIFNQNIGNWNITNVTEMSNMFNGLTLSIANYDALLNGWSALTLQNGVTFDGGNSQYCTGQAARNTMVNTFGWTITDGGQSCPDFFITTWKTDNTGVSNSTSIAIPTTGSGYNYDVDWTNDGIFDDFGVTGNISHDYGTPGTYMVVIRGSFPRIFFNNSNDREKILSIEQWGTQAWNSMEGAFWGCTNLVGNATDIPDLSNVTNMSNMFNNASSFNQDIGNWTVANVTNMHSMFYEALSFNQNIGNWNVGSVTDMENMFLGLTLSTANYDALLNGWSRLNLQNGVLLNAGSSNYCRGEAARDILINTFGWTISDGSLSCFSTDYFITTWSTAYGSTSIVIPTTGDGYDFDVDWNNDGVFDDFGLTGSITHDYGTRGTYTVAIRGNFPRIFFNGTGDSHKILSVDQWGSIQWSSMNNAFKGCSLLVINATDIPDLSLVTDTSSMFFGTSLLTANISNWDVSNVEDMSNMFGVALNFNQDIGNWNVENVTNMMGMFYASAFNQDLNIWNVSSVTNMSDMFSNASAFNGNISDWNVSNVNNMYRMFYLASSFNQDIGNWNVSNVSQLREMFRDASSFNQDIGNWDMQNISSLQEMFRGASAFNQDIGNWNVENVYWMNAMFNSASSFNQDIGNWNVSKVMDMNYMFSGAQAFNQDLSNWDVSNVTNMGGMFQSALAFDQDLGNWNVGKVTNMTDMFRYVTLSTTNYDALLNGWNTLPLQNGVPFSGGNSKYCSGQASRNNMIATFGWSITDGGQECFDMCGEQTQYTTAGGWSNGAPTNSKKVVFADNYITIDNIDACGIEIKPGVTVTVSAGTTIKAENNIVINGDLIFLSNASGNGELATMGINSSIVGVATVQRYMMDQRSYRMVSSSVTTTSSINANWQEGVHNTGTGSGNNQNPNPGFGTHISGSPTGADGLDATLTGNASMFTVDIANQTFVPLLNTMTNKLTAGNPYLMFVRGNRGIDLSNDLAHSETVLRATGSLVTGTNTQNFATTTLGDFAMFGNPYQSAVDINSVFANSTNVKTNMYYVYDPSLGDHGAYVTVNLPGGTNTFGSAASQYLQPGQGAQVATLADGASTIVFNESDKIPGQFTATNRPLSGNDMLTVQLFTSENFNSGGPVHDSFGIVFAEGNENGITPADAIKPMNFYENIGVNNNGTYLSIEQRALPQAAEVYPMYTTGYTKSDYTLKVVIDGLEANFLYLDDHFTGTSTLLETGENSYSFRVDANDALSIATDRFSIRTAQRLGVDDNSLLTGIRLFPNPLNGDTFYIHAPRLSGEQVTVSVSDLAGRTISEQSLNCQANTLTVPMAENIASGVYLVTLKHGEASNTFRLLKE